MGLPGTDPGFQVRGGRAVLKKMFGVYRVKNHDFTLKIIFFPIAEGGAKMFGVFRVKNHDFMPKNHIISSFRVRPPPWIRPWLLNL